MRLGCPIPGPFAEGCVATCRKFPDNCLEDGRCPAKHRTQHTNLSLRWDAKPNCKGRLSCGGGGGRAQKLNKSETVRLEQPSADQPCFGGPTCKQQPEGPLTEDPSTQESHHDNDSFFCQY